MSLTDQIRRLSLSASGAVKQRSLLVSASVLSYQVILVRAFSIGQWHHFAYMVISIALLGFGASGTLLAALERKRPMHCCALSGFPGELVCNFCDIVCHCAAGFFLAYAACSF